MTRVEGGPTTPSVLLPVPNHLSYSQITRLHPDGYRYACALQWAYGYRLGVAGYDSMSLHLGKTFDAGVTKFFEVRMTHPEWDGIPLAVAEAASTIQSLWPVLMEASVFEEPVDGEKAERYFTMVVDGLGLFMGQRRELIPAEVQTKHRFLVRGYDGEQIEFIGFSDRIDLDGVIVDHKWSGMPRWDDNGMVTGDHVDWHRERRDQIGYYWLDRKARAARGEPMTTPVVPQGRLEILYHRANMRQPQFRIFDLEPFTPADEERLLENLRMARMTAKSGIYPARPGEPCRFCDYVGRCRDDHKRAAIPFTRLTGVPG